MGELHVGVAAPAEERAGFVQGEAVVPCCCYPLYVLEVGLNGAGSTILRGYVTLRSTKGGKVGRGSD